MKPTRDRNLAMSFCYVVEQDTYYSSRSTRSIMMDPIHVGVEMLALKSGISASCMDHAHDYKVLEFQQVKGTHPLVWFVSQFCSVELQEPRPQAPVNCVDEKCYVICRFL